MKDIKFSHDFLDNFTMEKFKSLPLVIEGESKGKIVQTLAKDKEDSIIVRYPRLKAND
jgi:hypothetical protein